MLEQDIYIYNLKASDIYLFNKYGQSFFDKKYQGINPTRWRHISLLGNSLDIEEINPKKIPGDLVYRGLINVSFSKTAKVDGEVVLDTKQLRELLYKDGFDFEGKHYVRYKRSSGSGREGRCLFIEERLSKDMFPWTKCGLRASDKYDKDLVSYEAYKALSLSTIEKVIELDPHNILVVEDYESIFNDDNSIGIDIKDQELVVSNKKTITIKNSIWDGEGLLDESVFKQYNYENKGMMLLRNRFFKCCAFNTKLQQFFDEMIEKGVISDVHDLNGYTEAGRIEDIKLVVTYSSLKYIKVTCIDEKLAISNWMNNVSSYFGVVKTDKPTHEFLGEMVDTSYQFINTIGMNKEEVNKLVMPYLNYRNLIRNDHEMYMFYTKMHKYQKDGYRVMMDEDASPASKNIVDYQEMSFTVCQKLMNYNSDFKKTKLYGKYVSKLMDRFREEAYLGRLLVKGTNATLFGNGYELLLNVVGKFDKNNPTSLLSKGEIMCYHFKDEEEVVGARSPHITMGNLYLAKNKYYEIIDRYFNLSDEIVVVNAIKENIQQKLNGADYDSDTMLLTNNEVIVEAVKRNYHRFKVPVCLASSTNLTHQYTKDTLYKELARIDLDISHNKIGETVNLSQELNSVYWDKLMKGEVDELDKIYETICKLAVVSGMEIDKAKRSYDIKVNSFLKRTRNYVRSLTNDKKPLFFYYIDKSSPYSYEYTKSGKKKSTLSKGDYTFFNTPMDYVVEVIKENPLKPIYRDAKRVDISALINKCRPGGTSNAFAKDYLEMIKSLQQTIEQIYSEGDEDVEEESIVISEVNYNINEAIATLNNGLKNPATLYSIIKRLEEDEDSDRIILLGLYLVLMDRYEAWKDLFVRKFAHYEVVPSEEKEDFVIFDKFYKKVLKKAHSK